MKVIKIFCLWMALLGLSSFLDLQAQLIIDLPIQLPEELKADAGPDFQIDPGSWVIIGGTQPATGGTGDYFHIWSPADGLDNPYKANPVASPLQNTTYTLTIIDDRGCNAVDEVTVSVTGSGLEQLLDQSNCTVYPNPSEGIFTLQFNRVTARKIITIQVYNSVGEAVYIGRLDLNLSTGTEPIDLKNANEGIYLMQVSDGESQIMFKLIKE